jgi:hypothetical protein
MAHSDRCRIQDPATCFGCRVDGVGYDGGHLTKTTRDELGNHTREHRSGRVDVQITAPRLRARTTVQEDR